MIRVPVAKGTPGAVAYRTSPSVGVGPAGGYSPADLAAAYGYNPKVNRKSQLIGIVDWYNDPKAVKDLDAFDAHYGIPKETSTSFRVLNQKGKASPLPAGNKSTSVEESLDIESARSVCHTCRIVLLEANGPTTADTVAAENEAVRLGATEISNSFGAPEAKLSSPDINAYNHPGVVITASTGDDGWYAWVGANSGNPSDNAPEFPASSPNVVAVGGTSLELNSNATRKAEAVWNDNGADDLNFLEDDEGGGAGGGGCSNRYTAPAWQSHYSGYSKAGCGGKRLDADVAAIADPETGFDILDTYYSTTDGGWLTVGGTSLASPVVAAMFALAGGSGGAAYPASTLYVNGTQRSSGHYDVTTGGNSFCGGDTTTNCAIVTENLTSDQVDNPNGLGDGDLDCSFPLSGANVSTAPALSRQCNATSGFDGPSGLGAPKGLSMFTPTNPALSITAPSRPKAHRSGAYKVRVTERSPSTHVTGYKWRWGDGSSTTTGSGTAHHTYKTAGTYTMTLTVSDSRYQATVRSVRVKVTS